MSGQEGENRGRMTASENLRRELESIEGGIESLQETLCRVEDLRSYGARPGWLRALGVRILKADLRRRIRDLEQRRGVARNCFAEARKYESWLRRAENAGRWEDAVL